MSLRFVPAICVMAGFALIPTVIHTYVGVTVDDGRSAAAVPAVLAGFTSVPSGRSASWGKRRFESDDWIERRYLAGGAELTLTVVRSYDLKTLYHHPELAVAYGTPFVAYETRRFDADPSIPVHVLQSQAGAHAVALYVLHYDNGYVEHPIRFQARTAGELLFRGRRPMTLFFVQDRSVPPGADLETLPAVTLLFAAIDGFVKGSGAVGAL